MLVLDVAQGVTDEDEVQQKKVHFYARVIIDLCHLTLSTPNRH